jgi:4'-phosphopantetheinyl transferase
MKVFKNDHLEVFAFALGLDQDRGEIGSCLDAEERRRAAKFKLERDRSHFIETRAKLRRILASRLSIPPSEIELEYGCLGKPRLSARMPSPDLQFSVSRSAAVAVIALTIGREIGVDVEAVVSIPEADEIAAFCLSASDYDPYAASRSGDRLEAFLRHWTRLEAVSKALGCGLGEPFSWKETDWHVHSFVPMPGYVGTVVTRN